MNKKLKTQLIYLVLGLTIMVVICIRTDKWLNTETVIMLNAQEPAQTSSAPASTEATPEPVEEEEAVAEEVEGSNEYEEVKQKIIEVFGEHADKAFLLLQGEGCAENRGLDPDAVNDNTKWGGTGVDRGVFQINDFWQGIRHEGKAEQFLFDPEINIRIAWRLYEDDNYSFKLWTCGRYHGI